MLDFSASFSAAFDASFSAAFDASFSAVSDASLSAAFAACLRAFNASLSLDLLSSSILRTLLPDVHAQHVQNQAMRSHNLRAEHPTAACPRSRELNLNTARDTFIGFALSCREHVTDAHAAKHITSCNRAALACAAD